VELDGPSWPATPPTRPTAATTSSGRRSPRSCTKPPGSTSMRIAVRRRSWDELPRRWPAAGPAGPPAPGQGPAGGRGHRAGAGLPAAGRRLHRGSRGQRPQARQLKRRSQETPNPRRDRQRHRPDSRFLHTRNGTVQGSNAQAVTTLAQVLPQQREHLLVASLNPAHRGRRPLGLGRQAGPANSGCGLARPPTGPR